MSTLQIQAKLEKAIANTNRKFGVKAAALGNEEVELNVVPTPSVSLDYKLGIGGFPYGHMVEVFGGQGLGKTSALGYGVLANVQRQGKLPAIIAMEPTFDKEWVQRLYGLDPDLLLINRPVSAEEAMEMLYDLVFGGLVDYIMIDSFGAMATKTESEGKGKKAYGPAGVITSGLNAVMPMAYRNNVGILGVNQQRQSGNFNGNTLYDSPGGEGLKHHAMIRIHLKPGKNRYLAKIDGMDTLIGRTLVCEFKKNKLAEASGKKAEFDFFHIETSEYGLGVDVGMDYVNTGKITRVLMGSQWIEHPSFPGGKINGAAKAAEFIRHDPKAREQIRKEIIEKMLLKELQTHELAEDLEDGEEGNE